MCLSSFLFILVRVFCQKKFVYVLPCISFMASIYFVIFHVSLLIEPLFSLLLVYLKIFAQSLEQFFISIFTGPFSSFHPTTHQFLSLLQKSNIIHLKLSHSHNQRLSTPQNWQTNISVFFKNHISNILLKSIGSGYRTWFGVDQLDTVSFQGK